MRVFSHKGYEMTSLADLTEAMGINRTSMYAAFGNKESLFRLALEHYTKIHEKQFADTLAAGTARQGLEQILRNGVMMLTDPKSPGACFMTQSPLESPETSSFTQKFCTEKRNVAVKLLKARFIRAQEEGELLPGTSPEDLAEYYFIIILGMALQIQHGGSRAQLLRLVEIALAQWPE